MPTTVTRSVADLASAFRGIIDFQEQERGLVERRAHLFVVQVALLARLHIILHGHPGVAKSMTVDGILKHLPDLSMFKTQAYKASPPEQFLGQISIKGMADDRYHRLIARKLPSVEVAVVDELPRAPRALLPAFQGMMVEREFDSGDGVQPVPLQSLIGTSNHLPDDEELGAFFDRFALKLIVKAPQSQASFVEILKGALRRREQGEPTIPDELHISRDEFESMQAAVRACHVPDDVLERFGELWANLLGQGIEPSIRRYVDVTAAMQACAVLDGRDEVVIDDMQIAQHSLWTSEEEQPEVYKEVVRFASEWVKEKAQHIEAFNEILDRLGQVQSLIAAGADTSQRVTIGDPEDPKSTDSITEHAIKVANQGTRLRGIIEKHMADAPTGADPELQAVLDQIDGGREWIQDRIMGGLRI